MGFKGVKLYKACFRDESSQPELDLQKCRNKNLYKNDQLYITSPFSFLSSFFIQTLHFGLHVLVILAIAEKLQAVVPMSSGQMSVRPVTLVASLTSQIQPGQQTLSPGGTTPQQLAAAAQAGHQAAHQLVSAMAAQAQNTSQAQAKVGVYSQVGKFFSTFAIQ